MDEALEAAEVVADSELEGAVVWLLRIVGVVLVLAGVALWLVGGESLLAGLLWLPALTILVGVVLLTVPGIAFELLGG
jgi:hypothetical protein